jgi:CarD family transcriptional regulator
MNFKVKQTVFYPGHGVGQIDRIDTKLIMGVKHKFYVVKMTSGLTVLNPIKEPCFRALASFKQATKAFGIANSQPKLEKTRFSQRWGEQRFADFMKCLKDGSIITLAKAYSQLNTLRIEHDLSFGERKMLDSIEELLMPELEVVLKVKIFKMNHGLFAR